MTDNIQIKPATEADLEGVLQLLDENFGGTLSDEEKKDGFISVRFTLEELQDMNRNGITIVALSGSETAGGVSAQSCQWNDTHVPMAARMVAALVGKTIDGLTIDKNNSIVCGPVVVSKNFRGLGLLSRMYEVLKTEARSKYPIGLTLVSQANPRSIAAHEKLGMKKLTSFESDGRTFWAFAMRFDA